MDTLRPCANFRCAAPSYPTEQIPTTTCSKKTHRQRHGTLVGDVHTGLRQSGQDPRQLRKNLSHDGLRRSRSFGISVSRRQEERRHRAIQKKITALPWGPGHVHPCCCLCFDKQATAPSFSSFTPPVLSPSSSSRHKNCEGEVHQEHLQRSIASGTRCKRRRRFRTTAAINMPVCNLKTNNAHPMERGNRKTKCDKKSTSSRPPRTSRVQATSRSHGLDNQPSSAVGATVLRGLGGSQTEPLPALLFLHVDFSRSSLIAAA